MLIYIFIYCYSYIHLFYLLFVSISVTIIYLTLLKLNDVIVIGSIFPSSPACIFDHSPSLYSTYHTASAACFGFHAILSVQTSENTFEVIHLATFATCCAIC